MIMNDTRNKITLPDRLPGSGTLETLVHKARDYASKATADNTNTAYAKDWAHFASWCRRRGADPLPASMVADPRLIALYITECASPTNGASPLAVSTIERRLSGLSWNFQQRGFFLDRKDRHIASVLAGIKRQHARPPQQKEALLSDDIIRMLDTLDFSLMGLRDRAILLFGFAGGFRRSEIVSLDIGPDETDDGKGWVEITPRQKNTASQEGGIFVTLKTKTGWREVEIVRGSRQATCPVHALEQWLHYAKIVHGPIFRPVKRDLSGVAANRLSDKHVARLIKKAAYEAAIRPELSNKELMQAFSGHSLRAGLASSAEIDERYIQKQLGHASAEMTRRYQRRRDRFRINLTKAAGL